MAEAADPPTTYVLLSKELHLVADRTDSVPAAKELILDALRCGRLGWKHGARKGTSTSEEEPGWQLARWKNLHPLAYSPDRWWYFWCELEGRQITTDWENSWAECVAPDGSHYKLSLIQLNHADLLTELRELGLLPPELEPESKAASSTDVGSAPSPVTPDPHRTGAPGRPSATHIIEAEAKRRIDDGKVQPASGRIEDGKVRPAPGQLMAFAKVLESWWEGKRHETSGPPIKAATIADRIRPLWNAALSNAKPGN